MKIRTLFAGFLVLSFSCLDARARDLTFEERVDAQRAIEQVYWNHRIWPSDNRGPKPPLSTVMPDHAIRAKVENYLRESNALEASWDRPITAEQLQAEMDRMASNTRAPRVLQDLFDSLGNDPDLIAETLVRATLADRLITAFFQKDAQRQAGTFDAWWTETNRTVPTEASTVSGSFSLPQVDMTGCTDDTWAGTSTGANVPSARSAATTIWTGAEMVVWGGTDNGGAYNNGGRYLPSTDTWLPTSTGANVPIGRFVHTAVWTGSEMIVWGGFNNGIPRNTGGRYNPASDAWVATSTAANTPEPRGYHTAAWTGTEMIVWGGNSGVATMNTGGRYDPLSDTWAATSVAVNVPEARYTHTAVWTGSRMIVWGGDTITCCNTLDSGGLYDPTTDSWTPTATAAAPQPREEHVAVWTGTTMIVWGGYSNGNAINTGGRYNPSTDSWAATSTDSSAPSPRSYPSAAWTGAEMIVWGGYAGDTGVNTGGRYNPYTDSWAATSTGSNVPGPRFQHTAIWTGNVMIVWGGWSYPNYLNSGGRYCVTTCATPPPNYLDADGDGFGNPAVSTKSCDGSVPAGYVADSTDCNDAASAVHPGAPELCNGIDDDCSGQFDDDSLGVDSDGDGVRNACDNCRLAFNPDQLDTDHDGIGSACDNCALAFNPTQADPDADSRGTACDNCPNSYNPFQDDYDADRIGDACDNCAFDYNTAQSDFDHDNEGDLCDINDGLIYIYSTDSGYSEWQQESGYQTWNSYKGDLAVLKQTGVYTQAPGSNLLASRACGLTNPWVEDFTAPSPGKCAFFITTGKAGGVESGLGKNSAGQERPNTNPCP